MKDPIKDVKVLVKILKWLKLRRRVLDEWIDSFIVALSMLWSQSFVREKDGFIFVSNLAARRPTLGRYPDISPLGQLSLPRTIAPDKIPLE